MYTSQGSGNSSTPSTSRCSGAVCGYSGMDAEIEMRGSDNVLFEGADAPARDCRTTEVDTAMALQLMIQAHGVQQRLRLEHCGRRAPCEDYPPKSMFDGVGWTGRPAEP